MQRFWLGLALLIGMVWPCAIDGVVRGRGRRKGQGGKREGRMRREGMVRRGNGEERDEERGG